MTSRAQRLTLIVGVAVLVAVIAGAVMVPELTAAPKKKPPDSDRAFVITTAEENQSDVTLGTFVATGAIEDSGWAWEDFDDMDRHVYLGGSRGIMTMEYRFDKHDFPNGRFRVVAADGEYTDLIGVGGAYSQRWEEGGLWTYRTFEGSVPE